MEVFVYQYKYNIVLEHPETIFTSALSTVQLLYRKDKYVLKSHKG